MKIIYLLSIIVLLCTISYVSSDILDLTYSRVAYVDIDPLLDEDDSEQEVVNMTNAVNHIVAQGVNTVFIQAYHDGEGYTRVKKMYFPNTALGEKTPGRSQFVILANMLKAHGIAIGAWMPITAFDVTTINGKPAEYVLTYNDNTHTVEKEDCTNANFYCRLTPFNHDNYEWVLSLYKDLLVAYPDLYIINGHDDGAMNGTQDMSQSALQAYKNAGFSDQPEILVNMDWDSDENMKWAQFKSKTISQFFGQLITDLRKIKPSLKSSRNFYVNAFYQSSQGSVRWFAQDCQTALEYTDYIAPMVFPYMEKETPNTTVNQQDQFKWYFEAVVEQLKQCGPLEHFQMCLQAVDWTQSPYAPITDNEFRSWIQTSKDNGMIHFGWYPSNHYSDAISPKTTNGALQTAMYTPTSCSSSTSSCTSEQECIDGYCLRKSSLPKQCLSSLDEDKICTSTTQYCDTIFTNSCHNKCNNNIDCTNIHGNISQCKNTQCIVCSGNDCDNNAMILSSYYIIISSFIVICMSIIF